MPLKMDGKLLDGRSLALDGWWLVVQHQHQWLAGNCRQLTENRQLQGNMCYLTSFEKRAAGGRRAAHVRHGLHAPHGLQSVRIRFRSDSVIIDKRS